MNIEVWKTETSEGEAQFSALLSDFSTLEDVEYDTELLFNEWVVVNTDLEAMLNEIIRKLKIEIKTQLDEE